MEDAWARVCPFKSAHYSVPFVIQPGYTVCRVYVPFQECAVCTLVCVYHLYGGAVFIPHPLSQLSGGWQIPYSPKPTPYLNILSCFIVSGLIFRPEEKFKCMTSDVPGKTQKFGQCLKENVFSSGDVPLILSYILSCMRDYRFPTHQNQLLHHFSLSSRSQLRAEVFEIWYEYFRPWGNRNHFSSYLII